MLNLKKAPQYKFKIKNVKSHLKSPFYMPLLIKFYAENYALNPPKYLAVYGPNSDSLKTVECSGFGTAVEFFSKHVGSSPQDIIDASVFYNEDVLAVLKYSEKSQEIKL